MSDIELICLAWIAASVPVVCGLALEIHRLRQRLRSHCKWGGVCKKSYPVGYSRIAGYGYPNYPEEDGNVQSLCDPVVKKFQKKLNVDYRAHISEDGEPGPETHKALVSALQKELSIQATGKINAQTLADLKSVELQNGDSGKLVYIVQCLLHCKGYTSVGTPDGEFGPNTLKAVKAFQISHGLISDGIAGVLTLTKMLDSAG